MLVSSNFENIYYSLHSKCQKIEAVFFFRNSNNRCKMKYLANEIGLSSVHELNVSRSMPSHSVINSLNSKSDTTRQIPSVKSFARYLSVL